jgi:hypothetical protein
MAPNSDTYADLSVDIRVGTLRGKAQHCERQCLQPAGKAPQIAERMRPDGSPYFG